MSTIVKAGNILLGTVANDNDEMTLQAALGPDWTVADKIIKYKGIDFMQYDNSYIVRIIQLQPNASDYVRTRVNDTSTDYNFFEYEDFWVFLTEYTTTDTEWQTTGNSTYNVTNYIIVFKELVNNDIHFMINRTTLGIGSSPCYITKEYYDGKNGFIIPSPPPYWSDYGIDNYIPNIREKSSSEIKYIRTYLLDVNRNVTKTNLCLLLQFPENSTGEVLKCSDGTEIVVLPHRNVSYEIGTLGTKELICAFGYIRKEPS